MKYQPFTGVIINEPQPMSMVMCSFAINGPSLGGQWDDALYSCENQLKFGKITDSFFDAAHAFLWLHLVSRFLLWYWDTTISLNGDFIIMHHALKRVIIFNIIWWKIVFCKSIIYKIYTV